MKITIHRGQNQIGGSIIEIASDISKIILDAGSELDEEIPVAPQIEGLFFGQASYDAVLISHYHGDHIGLVYYAHEAIGGTGRVPFGGSDEQGMCIHQFFKDHVAKGKNFGG